MTENLTVRRARQEDGEAIAAFVREANPSTTAVGPAVVTEWLYGKGVWVAHQDRRLVGVAAWQAENLVSVTDVLYLAAAPLWTEVAGRLLATIEGEATVLMCEVNAVLLPDGPVAVRDFLRDQGYEEAELAELHRFWQEVLRDFLDAGPTIMIKRLRTQMVTIPQ